MTEFMYEVVCNKNLNFNKKTETYNEAYSYAQDHLSYKPAIYQVELDRNDFGECTAVNDKELVWRPEPSLDDLPEEEEDDYFESLARDLGLDSVDNDDETISITASDEDLGFDDDDTSYPEITSEDDEPMFFIEEVEQEPEEDCTICEGNSCECKDGNCANNCDNTDLKEDYGWTIDSSTAVDAAYDFIDDFGADTFINEIAVGLNSDELDDLVASLIKDFDYEYPDGAPESAQSIDTLDILVAGLGSTAIADDIIKYLSTDKLADLLAFIFRQYDYESKYLEESCDKCEQQDEIDYDKLREELEENEEEVECQECGELCNKADCTFDEDIHGYVCKDCMPAAPVESETSTEEPISWIYSDTEYGCYKQLADGNLVRISRPEYRELKSRGIKLWRKSDDEAITSRVQEAFENSNKTNSTHFLDLCNKAGIKSLGDLQKYMADNSVTEETLVAALEKTIEEKSN